ncbi:hypothetical protein KKD71_04990, partial [Patescibacteria group bacterium]|nr:hypothetical protein [Patescibacteria group bacterium]
HEFRIELRMKLGDEFTKVHSTPHAARRMSFTFKFVTVGVIVFVLLVGTGTGVYAYESPQVAEGHALYPMKQGIERVEGWFAMKPEGKAEYHMKMMGRRLDEAEMHEPTETMLEYAAAELGMSVEQLKSEMFDPSKRDAIVEQLISQNERFEEIFANMPPPPMPFEGMREKLRYFHEQVDEGQFSEDQRERLHEYFQNMINNHQPMNFLKRDFQRQGTKN